MVLLGRYRKICYSRQFPWSPWICLRDTQTCVTRGTTWFWMPNTQKLLPIWFCLSDTQNPLLGTPQYNARNPPLYTLLWGRIVKERLGARAKPAVYPGQNGWVVQPTHGLCGRLKGQCAKTRGLSGGKMDGVEQKTRSFCGRKKVRVVQNEKQNQGCGWDGRVERWQNDTKKSGRRLR